MVDILHQQKRIQKRISEGKTGAKLYDWWNINQVKNVSKEKTEHPCQIPEELISKIIKTTAPMLIDCTAFCID